MDELVRIDKKKCININKKDFTISIDAYRKYIKTIEAEGVRSIINREDIVNLAISINPTYINNIFSSSRCREYIRTLRVELEHGHFVDFLNIHIERFPEEETIRKEMVKYISRYRNRIIDISTLKAKNNIYFIQLKTYYISEEGKKKAGYIDIKCYRYIDKKLKIVFEETYKSIYLNPYIEGVGKGYINYNILQLKEMIDKNCYEKLCQGIEDIGYENEYYLLMSRYSEGIIAQALNDKETNIGFRLVEGDLKKLKEKKEKKQTGIS